MKKRTEEVVIELANKYCELVWYARKRPEDRFNPACEKPIKEIEFKYPNEILTLQGVDGDWEHGFNSGMLAALRLILDAESGHLEMALEEFPCLDT